MEKDKTFYSSNQKDKSFKKKGKYFTGMEADDDQ